MKSEKKMSPHPSLRGTKQSHGKKIASFLAMTGMLRIVNF
jgi:hypothetical protein